MQYITPNESFELLIPKKYVNVLLVRNPQKAKEMEKAVKERDVEKTYFARVKGDFPQYYKKLFPFL